MVFLTFYQIQIKTSNGLLPVHNIEGISGGIGPIFSAEDIEEHLVSTLENFFLHHSHFAQTSKSVILRQAFPPIKYLLVRPGANPYNWSLQGAPLW